MDNEYKKDIAEIKVTLANMQKSIDTILKALNDNKLAEIGWLDADGNKTPLYYTELNSMSTQACNI